jgi:hypothetical protein
MEFLRLYLEEDEINVFEVNPGTMDFLWELSHAVAQYERNAAKATQVSEVMADEYTAQGK